MKSDLSEKVCAWLVEGGRAFVDRPVLLEAHAAMDVLKRKDGSIKAPLIRLSDAQSAVSEAAQELQNEQQRAGREIDYLKALLTKEFGAGWEDMDAACLRVANRRAEAAERERDAFRKELDIRTHQVITCGVAATHPDADLTRTGAYATKWDSQQAEEVRAIRRERDALREALAELVESHDAPGPDDNMPCGKEWLALLDICLERKRCAWEAARAALSGKKETGE